jgi:hypothetical protein
MNNLPFAAFKPIIYGAIYGLLIRAFIFGGDQGWLPGFQAMSLAFIFAVPFVVGALTVFWAEKIENRSYLYYIFAPWLATLLFMLGSMVTLLEGSICIIIIAPIFIPLSSIGGIVMGAIIRHKKNTSHKLQIIAFFPLCVVAVEQYIPLNNQIAQLSSSIEIKAPAETVWYHLNNATHIKESEIPDSLAYLIGAPKPISGKTILENNQRVRKSVWQKGVYFDEQIVAWQENEFISWTYQFFPDSFPKGSMDDHVVIGGQYFDLMTTSYRLETIPLGTKLTLEIQYRVSTKFNWYTRPLARYLIQDSLDSLLHFYQVRNENIQ